MPLSETWVREYVAHVAEMLRLMDESRSTLSNSAMARFAAVERIVRTATTEGQRQTSRGTLVMYDPESGAEWKRRCEEYALVVLEMRDQQRGFPTVPGTAAAEALAATESVVDALTAVMLLPAVPEVPTYPEGGSR